MKFTMRKTATLLAAAGLMSPAFAATGQYEMHVLEGYASSHALLDGDYEKAIKLAESRLDSNLTVSRLANETTLCVALAKTGQLESAAEVCDQAAGQIAGYSVSQLTTLGMDVIQAEEFSDIAEQNQTVVKQLLARQ